MGSNKKSKNYWLTAIRWVARILAGLLAALVLVLVLCHAFSEEGLPNPLNQPLPVAIELFAMLTMWIGLIVGWKYQGSGAILTIGGIMTFHIIEKRLWLMGAFPLFDLAGILFLLCWWLKWREN